MPEDITLIGEIQVPEELQNDFSAVQPFNRITELKRLNVLIGPNNSGKSRFLRRLFASKKLLVSRVLPEDFEDFAAWRFWNGQSWDNDYLKADAITDSVSNELSMTPLPNGQYLLVFTAGVVDQTVDIRIGETPLGPFGPVTSVWDCSEAIEEPEFFAYNAKAHPSLSKPGELLISYNVNSFAFWDQVRDYPNLYRPRFFKLRY